MRGLGFLGWCLALALCAGLPTSAVAKSKGTLYFCSFDGTGARGGGWVPSQVAVVHDPASGDVEVFDPIIKHFVGNPIKGKTGTETKARIGFRWEVRVNDGKGTTATIAYSLTYYKDGRPAQMTATPKGDFYDFDGSGTCKVGPA